MHILKTINIQLKSLARLLGGKRVGIFPGNLNRCKTGILPFLKHLNVTALYDPFGYWKGVDVNICKEKDEFLQGMDVCIAFGVDQTLMDLWPRAKEIGAIVPAIVATDKTDPNSLLYQPNPYRFIELRNVSDANREWMKTASIQLEYLQVALISTHETQRALVKASGLPEYRGRWEGHFHPFESCLLEYGLGVSACPVCGKACHSHESFVVRDCVHFLTFYRFVCHGEFFIMKGSPVTVGMYLPESETIIRYIDEDVSLGPLYYNNDQLACDVDRLKEYVLYNMDEVEAYLTQESTRSIQCIVGNFAPIGHHLINELTGIQHIIETGMAHRLENVLVALNDYFDLKSLFPEIGKVTNLTVGREYLVIHGIKIFRRCLQNNYFAIQFYHSGPIQESLANRLLTYSKQRVRRETIAAVEQSSAYRPRIWVTLRSGNRHWRSQEDGLVYVLGAFYKKHPKMVVVFDGLPKEEPRRQYICERLPETLFTINALHCTREETIYWTHSIDVHLSPVGNGAVFLSLANKPGVYYSSNSILSHYLSPNGDDGTSCLHRRENPQGSLPARATIEYQMERDMHYRDYEVDVEELLKQADVMIKKTSDSMERMRS